MVGANRYDWRLDKAERFLLAAGRAFESEDWETAISKSYYALYHAVIAVLEAKAGVFRRRWNHDELQYEFRSRFAERGFLFNLRHYRDFVELYQKRLAADYEPEQFRRPQVEELLARARRFHERIVEVIQDA